MNYYNENDPKTAAWLQSLINENLIPYGHVDTRSIVDVSPDDLTGFHQCHFFAGIGGWPLALALAGWPEDRPVWTGSCPCQPFSVAGKGKGVNDARHLWPVFAELIRACHPSTVFGEQVASADGRKWLAGVFADLEGMGYRRAGADLCAAGVGAPHIRQRLYWVADAMHSGWTERRAITECGQIAGSGGPNGMVQPIGEGLERYAWDGDDWHKSEWDGPQETGPTSTTSDAGGVVFADMHGCQSGSASAAPPGHGDSVDSASSGIGGMEHSRSCALPQCDRRRTSDRPAHADQWAGSSSIICRDGKARRIPAEPSFFPLVDGVSSARVGILRGAGNAIVPAVAEEFVRAFMEC